MDSRTGHNLVPYISLSRHIGPVRLPRWEQQTGGTSCKRGHPSKGTGITKRAEAERRRRREESEDDEDWQPFEDEAMQVAAEYSVNPETFGPKTRSVGPGFLAATAWGRKNGIPQRPLVPG